MWLTSVSIPAESVEIDMFFLNEVSITVALLGQKYSDGRPLDTSGKHIAGCEHKNAYFHIWT